MKRNIIIGLSLLVFSNTLLAQKEESLGNWLMYFGTHKINEKFSLHYETQLRNYKVVSNFNQLLPRVGINYKIDENSMVTGGYALIPTQSQFNDGWNEYISVENRIWQQFILRNKVNNIKLRHRYRLEQRWIKQDNFTDFKNRARYMISAKIPLSNKEDFPIFLSIYDEIFLNISDAPFDQNRLFGAIVFQVNKSMNIQAGYLRHRSGDLNLNRLQLAVFLNTGN
jgi:hypothetical protein